MKYDVQEKIEADLREQIRQMSKAWPFHDIAAVRAVLSDYLQEKRLPDDSGTFDWRELYPPQLPWTLKTPEEIIADMNEVFRGIYLETATGTSLDQWTNLYDGRVRQDGETDEQLRLRMIDRLRMLPQHAVTRAEASAMTEEELRAAHEAGRFPATVSLDEVLLVHGHGRMTIRVDDVAAIANRYTRE